MTSKTLQILTMASLSYAEHCNSNAECFCLDLLQLYKDRDMLWCAINRKDTESENTGTAQLIRQEHEQKKHVI